MLLHMMIRLQSITMSINAASNLLDYIGNHGSCQVILLLPLGVIDITSIDIIEQFLIAFFIISESIYSGQC